MTALSVHLPDQLAKASQIAANQLGISRTEFFRQAITHELENFHLKMEQEAMARSFVAMKKDNEYLNESDELDKLTPDLPIEKDEWWKNS